MQSVLSADYFQSEMEYLLEKIAKTGTPLKIEHKGKIFTITGTEPLDKLSNLQPHPGCMTGDPEDIVHIDWIKEWKHDLP
jgi:hypothetical protein